MDKKNVTVIGSYNVGLFLKGEVIPFVGQTVIGDKFYEGGGGKGSNQAIAASKMSAETIFVGRIGNDKYGSDALELYNRYGISTGMIKADTGIHTGISVILIDKDGQNSIMVVPGANFNLSREDIDSALDVIRDSYIVGFQLESNFDIKPNEHEAAILSGIKVTDVERAEKAGRWFRDRGVDTAIITLGKNGSVMVTGDKTQHFETPDLKPVDTTGTGDCFSGALMCDLSN